MITFRALPFIALAAWLAGCSGTGTQPAASQNRPDADRYAPSAPNDGVARRSNATNRLYYVNVASVLQQRRLTGGNGRNAKFTRLVFGGPAVDTAGNVYAIYANQSKQNYVVVVFDPTLHKVVRTLNLSSNAMTLAVDAENRLYVPYIGSALVVFAAGASGNASPLRVISGEIPPIIALAADKVGRIFALADTGPAFSKIVFIDKGANGPQGHLKSIFGSQTGLDYPQSIALGADGNMYVVNQLNGSLYGGYQVLVFPETGRGNIPPLRTLQSPTYGATLALGAGGEMYLGPIPNQANQGIAIYAPGAAGDPDPIGFVGPPITKTAEFPIQMTLEQPWSDR
jgi:hypothetical protein